MKGPLYKWKHCHISLKWWSLHWKFFERKSVSFHVFFMTTWEQENKSEWKKEPQILRLSIILFKYIWCNWRDNSPLCRDSLDEDLTSEIELVHEKMIQVDVITFVGVDNNFKLQPLSAPFGHLFAGTFLIIMPSLSKLIKVIWWCKLESFQNLNFRLATLYNYIWSLL